MIQYISYVCKTCNGSGGEGIVMLGLCLYGSIRGVNGEEEVPE